MKKKVFIIIDVLIVMLFCLLFIKGVYILFDSQYNMETGVSSRINITIDKNQEKIKIGNLDGYDIFIEGLKVNECYFTTINAKTISLVDAINERKVSIEDMIRIANMKKEEDSKYIYYYENYKIEIENKEVLIKNI